MRLLLLVSLFAGLAAAGPARETADAFVARAEKELHDNAKKSVVASWNYYTNITDHNAQIMAEASRVSAELKVKLGLEAQQFDISEVEDESVKRKLDSIGYISTSILEEEDLNRYFEVVREMQEIYSTALVDSYDDTDVMLPLDPDLTKIFATSEDPDELEYYWTAWREQSGKLMRDLYKEYIQLINKAAKLNGYEDGSEMWVHIYESPTFIEEMAQTWEGIRPLYEQMHAYTRYKLRQKYGEEVVPKKAPIPAHLLGNMWAQTWDNVGDILRPYPAKPDVDITQAMLDQGYTPQRMFELSDQFFQSIGFEPFTDKFWSESVLERPDDGRDLVCHASAWDFYTGDDFRVKMCTVVNQIDFNTVNHEMGHIQYYQNYKDQSYLFRNGANPGFHEAMAEISSLATSTVEFFQSVGLLDESVDVLDEETNINVLFNTALRGISFLPFGYLMDAYRWDLMAGRADMDDLNCHWVNMRQSIQGVSAPGVRDETQFDAGAKYHVAASVPYVRYFVAFVYQFQFYKELCIIANEYEEGGDTPLHHCNFAGSTEAGDKLKEMLSLGSSKPWKEVMKLMTGQTEMDTAPLREYFKPLEDWLRKKNEETGEFVGWENDPDLCTN